MKDVTDYIEIGREEIQRIKAGNPDISHREAFSAAAKNVQISLYIWFLSFIYFLILIYF